MSVNDKDRQINKMLKDKKGEKYHPVLGYKMSHRPDEKKSKEKALKKWTPADRKSHERANKEAKENRTMHELRENDPHEYYDRQGTGN